MPKPTLGNMPQGFRYVLASQLIVLVLGLLKAFLIPLLLDIQNYGYWQVYVLYTAYAGLFCLGFSDGLYLRYGGYRSEDLPLTRIRPSVQVYTVLLLIESCVFATYFSFDSDPDRQIVMYLVAVNIALMGLLVVFSHTLQATNQLRRFGLFNSADKIFFLLLLPALVVLKIDSYLYFAYADLASKLFLLLLMFVLHKELLFGHCSSFVTAWHETVENIKAGSLLMIANVSGMLVLSIGRFIIEYYDTIDNYAYYAFGVSMTNLVLFAITALSIAIYPTLKRLPELMYLDYYSQTNRVLLAFNSIMLFAYFPAVLIITEFLPKYEPSIKYLNILFAITALEGKMQLLNNTYYKVLRLESAMMRANISSLIVAVALASLAYATTKSIQAIAASTFATMAIRVYASERYLRRQMGDYGYGLFHLEFYVFVAFLGATYLLPLDWSLAAFSMLLAPLLFRMRREARVLFRQAIGSVK